jgi:hypothetical protein
MIPYCNDDGALPRSAILQSAVASSVDGILAVTVSTAERTATFGSLKPRTRERSIAFWQMSRFPSRFGKILIAGQ